jgi:hypothetical protein
MNNKSLLIILVLVCILVGWLVRGIVENSKKLEMNKAMAWGFEEKSQLWNRIRVDEQGFVMCHVYNEEKK